jgi:hypothetical protein
MFKKPAAQTAAILAALCAIVCAVAPSPANAASGRYWNTGLGGTTMKFLSMQASPRSAALSGAGVASPVRLSEVTRNPLAVTSVSQAEIGYSQTVFGDAGADNFVNIFYGLPLNDLFALSMGIEFLGYGDIEGRDEEGFLTDDYSAYAWAAQAGIGNHDRAFGWSVQARFAYQTIDDESTVAILGDAGALYRVSRYFSLGATITNFGYATDSEYDNEHEATPMALQAGVSGTIPVGSLLHLESMWDIRLSADIYRRADMEDPEWRFGGEVSYQEFISLRAGYALRPETEDGLSAGIGISFGSCVFDYGYSPRVALGSGNHYLGVGYRF